MTPRSRNWNGEHAPKIPKSLKAGSYRAKCVEVKPGRSGRILITWTTDYRVGVEEQGRELSRSFPYKLEKWSALVAFVECWLGREIPQAELAGLDLPSLLVGEFCVVSVLWRTSKAGKNYPFVAAAVPYDVLDSRHDYQSMQARGFELPEGDA